MSMQLAYQDLTMARAAYTRDFKFIAASLAQCGPKISPDTVDNLATLRWKICAFDYVLTGLSEEADAAKFAARKRAALRRLILAASGNDGAQPPAFYAGVAQACEILEKHV